MFCYKTKFISHKVHSSYISVICMDRELLHDEIKYEGHLELILDPYLKKFISCFLMSCNMFKFSSKLFHSSISWYRYKNYKNMLHFSILDIHVCVIFSGGMMKQISDIWVDAHTILSLLIQALSLSSINFPCHHKCLWYLRQICLILATNVFVTRHQFTWYLPQSSLILTTKVLWYLPMKW